MQPRRTQCCIKKMTPGEQPEYTWATVRQHHLMGARTRRRTQRFLFLTEVLDETPTAAAVRYRHARLRWIVAPGSAVCPDTSHAMDMATRMRRTKCRQCPFRSSNITSSFEDASSILLYVALMLIYSTNPMTREAYRVLNRAASWREGIRSRRDLFTERPAMRSR